MGRSPSTLFLPSLFVCYKDGLQYFYISNAPSSSSHYKESSLLLPSKLKFAYSFILLILLRLCQTLLLMHRNQLLKTKQNNVFEKWRIRNLLFLSAESIHRQPTDICRRFVGEPSGAVERFSATPSSIRIEVCRVLL